MQPVLGVLGDDRLDPVWDDGSALPGMSVGALTAHLARAIVRAPEVLADRTDDPPDAPTAGAYYARAGISADRASDVNVGVRARSVGDAEPGRVAVLATATDAAVACRQILPALPLDAVVCAFASLRVPVWVYLKTRILEIAAHVDDLEASVPGLRVTLPEAAWTVATEVGLDAARANVGDRELLRALCRSERSRSDVFPVF